MQIQTCAFVLGVSSMALYSWDIAEKGKVRRMSSLPSLPRLRKIKNTLISFYDGAGMYSIAFGNPISRDFCVNLYMNFAEFESSEFQLTISIFEAGSSVMPEPGRWSSLYWVFGTGKSTNSMLSIASRSSD